MKGIGVTVVAELEATCGHLWLPGLASTCINIMPTGILWGFVVIVAAKGDWICFNCDDFNYNIFIIKAITNKKRNIEVIKENCNLQLLLWEVFEVAWMCEIARSQNPGGTDAPCIGHKVLLSLKHIWGEMVRWDETEMRLYYCSFYSRNST